MENKTCGECRFFESKEFICCHSGDDVAAHFIACYDFEPMARPKSTNGDKIRRGGDKALAEISIYSDQLDNGIKVYRSTLLKEKYWLSKACAVSCVEHMLNEPAKRGKNEE